MRRRTGNAPPRLGKMKTFTALVTVGHMSVGEWNRLVDGFDAEALAKQLQSAGAGYYQITIGQNSGYYLAPNSVYDRTTGITPSKCSRRDVVADLFDALDKRGIKLMVY